MAVIAHVVIPGISSDQYDKVREVVGWLDSPPTGGISHVTWWDGDDCHNVDAWESETDFNNFAEQRLGPGMAQVGVAVTPQVTFHSAHEVFAPNPALVTR
jgi:hypothetical protein